MPAPFLSVVIPAYNEERRLPDTLATVTAYLGQQPYSWEILVADDGSSDATAEIVRSAARTCQALRLVSLPHRGKGSAVKHGMLAAQGQYRFLCDADLSMPISGLPRLLPPAAPQRDIVIGSREANGAQRVGEPRRRYLMGRVFNTMTRLILLPRISDTQCGFKVIAAPAAQTLFPLQTLDGFGFDSELLFLASRYGYTLDEVGIEWHYRTESKVRPVRDGWRTFLDLLRIRWRWATGHYQGKPNAN